MAVEQIELQVNGKQALSALLELNRGIANTEAGVGGATSKLQTTFDKLSQFVVQSTDKSTKALIRHVDAIEKQATAYGKTPIERLNAQREIEVKRIQASTASLDQQTAAINRVNAAYQKMVAVESGGGKSGLQAFGQGLQSFVQNPMGAVGSTASSVAETLGPVALGIAGIAAAAVGAGVAMFSLTKSFSEDSEALVNLSHSSGIALGDLDRLQAMAKLTGSDISSLARAGTVMASALEDGGQKGQKMQQALGKLHVDAYNLNGTLKDEGVILVDTLKALSQVSDVNERMALAAETLGNRTAKSLYPIISDYDKLNDTVKKFGYGTRNDVIQAGDEAAKKLHEMGLAFDQLKAYMAIGAVTLTEWVGGLHNLASGVVASLGPLGSMLLMLKKYTDLKEAEAKAQLENDPEYKKWQARSQAMKAYFDFLNQQSKNEALFSANRFSSAHPEESLKADISDLEEKRQKAINLIQSAKSGSGPGKEAEAQAEKDFLNADAQIKAKEKLLKAIQNAADYTNRLREEEARANETELDGLSKIESKRNERIRQMAYELQTSKTNLGIIQQIFEIEKNAYEKQQQQKTDAAQFDATSNAALSKIRNDAALASATRRLTGTANQEDSINAQYKETIGLATKARDIELDKSMLIKDYGEREAAQIRANAKLDEETKKAELDRQIQLMELEHRRHEDADKAAKAELENQRKLADATTQIQNSIQDAATRHQNKMRDITGNRTPAEQITNIRLDETANEGQAFRDYYTNANKLQKEIDDAKAAREKALDENKIQLTEKIGDLETKQVQNAGQLWEKINQDRYSAEEKIAEIQQKQLEEIKAKTAGLLHTLFTDPHNFEKQFKTTLRDAALKPVEDTLSTGISKEIFKTLNGGKLPGETKLGDLQGIGKVEDSLKVYVTNNQSAGQHFTSNPSFYSRGSGGGFIPSFGGGFIPGLGGSITTPPFVDNGAMVSSAIDFGKGPEAQSSAYYPGSTSAVEPSFGTPGTTGASPFGGLLSQLLKGGGSAASGGSGGSQGANPGGSWVNKLFGGSGGFGGLTRSPITEDEDGTTSGGNITGVNGMAGGLLQAGGMALAMHGLLGPDEGTGKGIAEGAVGGAAVGFKYGGPIGAAIGAAVGAGIGLGEMLAGVESPQHEAKRLVKQRYGLNIDSKTADYIVQLAKQKYAGKVSLAVMSPEVRQMLMLYAASTGQKMPMSATTPHAASFSETNGQLQQEATYQYGQAFTYQSNFPTAGGVPSQTFPTGSNVPMSLNIAINGTGAGQFMQGQVSPEFVQAQWGNAQASSVGRTQNAATMMYPGLQV